MQRKFKFLLLFVSAIILACNSFHSASTEDTEVLSQDQMIQVLTDIHIAEAKVTDLAMSGDTVAITEAKYYQVVFDKNKTNAKQFEKSYKYYTTKPVQLDSIYQQVITNLAVLENTHKNDFMHPQAVPERLIENLVK